MYRFSWLISVHFLEELLQRVSLKIKAFLLSWSSTFSVLVIYWYRKKKIVNNFGRLKDLGLDI